MDAEALAAMGSGNEMEQMAAMQQQKQAMEEQRLSILDQILTDESKSRLTRMRLVKEEKARQIEDYIIKAAQSGQLRNKVTEEELVALINQADAAAAKKKVVTTNRKKYSGLDDDSDDNDDDLM